MARITTNTTGTQPIIEISTSNTMANSITLPFVQDVTVTNSTGIYSYTTFSDVDMRKLSTPADNEISVNVVLDSNTWFGSNSAGTTATDLGISNMSINKQQIYFEVYYAGNTANAWFTSGTGYLTSLAPTVNPEAPVWVSPLTIAVDGGLTNDQV